jgi:hypothetical protein
VVAVLSVGVGRLRGLPVDAERGLADPERGDVDVADERDDE